MKKKSKTRKAFTIDSLLTKAIALHNNGDLHGAIRGYDDLLKKAPNNFNALHLSGVAELQSSNYVPAIQKINKAISGNPNHSIAHFNLALAYAGQGLLENAEQSFKKAIDIDPFNTKAHLNLGALYRTQRRNELAIDETKQALLIEPDNLAAHLQLGSILLEIGDYGEAEKYARSAIQLSQIDPLSHLLLGNVLASQAKYPEALLSLDISYQLDPTSWECNQALSAVLSEVGRHDDAENAFARAHQINPTALSLVAHKATLLHRKGNLSCSKSYCKTVLDEVSNDPAMIELMGQIAIDEGNLVEACEYLKMNYESPENHRWKLESGALLATASYLQGRFEEASKLTNALVGELTNPTKMGRIAAAYTHLTKALLENRYSTQASSNQTAYVLAESHGLSHHGNVVTIDGIARRCKALWIPGIKQWHLANATPNNYKSAFDIQMSNIPTQSTVLIAIGEIDCRLETGIIPFSRKNPHLSTDEVTKKTVSGYLEFVKKSNVKWQHELIIQGIPAPNLDLEKTDPNDARLLAAVIDAVNAELKQRSRDMGYRFLDVHAMTNKRAGFADGTDHIDQHHLIPKACVRAFSQFLVT